MEFNLRGKILLIGIGETGSKMATEVSNSTGWDHIQIGSHKDTIPTCGVLNPSMHLLRANAYDAIKKASSSAHKYDSVIIMAALGEKEGAALAPMLLLECKDVPSASFVTMPFGFETERIFESGVALRRVKESSGFVAIIDNEAMHKSNPDLSIIECSKIACDAAVHVAISLQECSMQGKVNIVSASRPKQNIEESLHDSLKMLYSNTSAQNISHSILHISGKSLPVGMLDAASKLLHDACTSASILTTGGESLIMTSTVTGQMHFDSYDPLGTIPEIIDWDEPECSIETGIKLRQIE